MNQRRKQRIQELEAQLDRLKSETPCSHHHISCADCGREINITKLSQLLTVRFQKLQDSLEACQGFSDHIDLKLATYRKNAELFKNVVDKLLEELDESQ